MAIVIGVMAVYLVVCLVIGIYARGKVKTEDDFLAAGGKVGVFVGGSTLAAAQMSVGTSIGMVGFHYVFGYNFTWTWIALWVGWVVNAFWIAPKMKNFYNKTGSLTIPDLLGVRFESNIARSASALVLLIAFGLTIVAELVGIGTIFSVAMNIKPLYTIIVCAIVFIVYTIGGGLFSVVYTNLFQMAVFLFGFLFAAIFAVSKAGGLIALNNSLAAIDPNLVANGMPVRTLLSNNLSGFLMMVGYPLIAMRFYAIKDTKAIRGSIGVAFILQAIVGASVVFCGVAARVLYPNLATPDNVTATLAIELLPAFFGGLLLAAVLASSQSTASAVLLMVSSALSHDIIKVQIKPHMDEKTLVRVSRICMIIIGLVCIPFSLFELPLIQQIWINAGVIIGSSFAVSTFFGLAWRRASNLGGPLSIILGFLGSGLWMMAGNPYGVSGVYCGLISSLIGMFAGSFASPPPKKEIIDMFFS